MKRASYCRVCLNSCPVLVEVEDNRVTSVTGHPDNDIFAGYTCVKGRAQAAIMSRPERLLRSLARTADGTQVRVDVEEAVSRVASELESIVNEHGPRAVAGYLGTNMMANVVAMPIFAAFFAALGSPMFFTPSTIDKPGREVARALHGGWMAPAHGFQEPDMALLFGLNPFRSYYGVACGHPGKWLSERVAAGMKVIVVDPCETDIAKRADIHLQLKPGQDSAILACLIHVVMREALYDAEFVEENTVGLAELKATVASFTPDVVAERAGVAASDLVEAARWYATARRSYAAAGVGPGFAASGTLVNYLIMNLEALCGRYLRAGDEVTRTVTLMPAIDYRAQAAPPTPAYGTGELMQATGIRASVAGMPVAMLPDEILLENEGRVRALLSCGGAPIGAWPDQLKAIEAMHALDLLVQFDPWMSPTAEAADIVVAPTMPYEVPGATIFTDQVIAWPLLYGPAVSHAQYTPAVVSPPTGADVIPEWEFMFRVAQRMGLQLRIGTKPVFSSDKDEADGGYLLDMGRVPTADEMLELMTAGSRVPLSEVQRHPGGATFPEPRSYVKGKDPGWTGRLQLADPDMMRDLEDLWAGVGHGAVADESTGDYPLRLISRRIQHTMNSSQHFPETNRGRGFNPLGMHPDDMISLGLSSGDAVRIESRRAAVLGIVEADRALRQGIVTIAQGFGGLPEHDAEFREIGTPINRLLDNTDIIDPYVGVPRMGNVPVRVVPYTSARQEFTESSASTALLEQAPVR